MGRSGVSSVIDLVRGPLGSSKCWFVWDGVVGRGLRVRRERVVVR